MHTDLERLQDRLDALHGSPDVHHRHQNGDGDERLKREHKANTGQRRSQHQQFDDNDERAKATPDFAWPARLTETSVASLPSSSLESPTGTSI